MLLLRTKELDINYKPASYAKQFKFEFNVDNANLQLEESLHSILETLEQDSTDKVLEALEGQLIPILKSNKIKITNPEHKRDTGVIIETCNHLYKKLQHSRNNYPNDDNRINKDLEEYQKARNNFNTNTCQLHESKYSNLLQNGDERKLWEEINWAGKYKAREDNHIHNETMADYFENLYEPLMKNLNSTSYTPIFTYQWQMTSSILRRFVMQHPR